MATPASTDAAIRGMPASASRDRMGLRLVGLENKARILFVKVAATGSRLAHTKQEAHTSMA
ncbi:hypothetical protein [Streptomyces sp. MJP52]|uniref:hypothetical protein n=1 Tax=Streptomyces sp. MJP52 TaxID=2940555 RepID=UPI0024744656|nr:hypothetical protein [Streptomyces sp. MJP52]